MAINHAQKEVRINRDIFTLFMGTPISAAVSFEAPVAKIQLPICVLLRKTNATTPITSHQRIDMGNVVPPIFASLLNKRFIKLYPLAVSRPPIWVRPVIILEIPIVIPRIIKRDPRVIINDGKPVFPTDNPKYVCVINVDSPRYGLHWGNETAVPIVKDIFERLIINNKEFVPVESKPMPQFAHTKNIDKLVPLLSTVNIIQKRENTVPNFLGKTLKKH